MDKTGGQAFPIQDMGAHGQYGMTLRDYFAAKAMQTLIGIPEQDGDFGYEEAPLAVSAYRLADAMLAARGAA